MRGSWKVHRRLAAIRVRPETWLSSRKQLAARPYFYVLSSTMYNILIAHKDPR